jgi:hypothetical protein
VHAVYGLRVASMPLRLLVAVLVIVCAVPASAAKRGRVRQCKLTCGPAIQRCIDEGGKKRKCKRKTLRRCKKQGLPVCAVPGGTFTVATTGTDAGECGTEATPCRTIQFVLDTLVPYGQAGTIKVATGSYDDMHDCPTGVATNTAVVCIINRQITLRGGFVPPDWTTPTGDPSATVIDGNSQGRGLRIHRGLVAEAAASIEMDGFTIKNGAARGATSGGLGATSAAGGGMLSENSTVTLRNMVFRDNLAVGGTTGETAGGRGSGGGLALFDESWANSLAPATLQNVTFDGNQAQGGDGADAGGYALGGALFVYWTPVTGDNVVLSDNAATAGNSLGGGVSGNDKADALGGAVSVEQDAVVALRNVQASGNLALGGNAPNGEGGGAFGGVFFVELADLSVSEAVLGDNRAQGGNGMNSTTSGSIAQGGAVQALRSALGLDRVAVVGNEARAGDGATNGGAAEGGGVAVIVAERNGVAMPFHLTNAVVASNFVSIGSGTLVPGGGGGLWLQGATATISHTTIADNRLGSTQMFHHFGGGIAVFSAAGVQTAAAVTDSILANHSTPGMNAQSYADAALWAADNTSIQLTRVLFANNSDDTNAGVSDGFNLPPGAFAQTAVTNAANGGFVSSGNPSNDYHLTAGSPARDQAVGSTVAVDLDGTARPNGVASDLGAYEFH